MKGGVTNPLKDINMRAVTKFFNKFLGFFIFTTFLTSITCASEMNEREDSRCTTCDSGYYFADFLQTAAVIPAVTSIVTEKAAHVSFGFNVAAAILPFGWFFIEQNFLACPGDDDTPEIEERLFKWKMQSMSTQTPRQVIYKTARTLLMVGAAVSADYSWKYYSTPQNDDFYGTYITNVTLTGLTTALFIGEFVWNRYNPYYLGESNDNERIPLMTDTPSK